MKICSCFSKPVINGYQLPFLLLTKSNNLKANITFKPDIFRSSEDNTYKKYCYMPPWIILVKQIFHMNTCLTVKTFPCYLKHIKTPKLSIFSNPLAKCYSIVVGLQLSQRSTWNIKPQHVNNIQNYTVWNVIVKTLRQCG